MGMEPVDDVPLSSGDQFRIGGTHMVFHSGDNPTEVFEEAPDWS
jgi:hypothetical protein